MPRVSRIFRTMLVSALTILANVLYRKNMCNIVFLASFTACRTLTLWFPPPISTTRLSATPTDVTSISIERTMNTILLLMLSVPRKSLESLCYA